MKISLIRIGVASLLMAGFISMAGIAFHDREVKAAGNTYYVATNGSDSNPCTLSAPCATLDHAKNKLGPGDTLQLRGGDYSWGPITWVGVSGTSGSPIIVENYPGEKPVWYLTGSGGLHIWNSSHVTFRGIVFDGANGTNDLCCGGPPKYTYTPVSGAGGFLKLDCETYDPYTGCANNMRFERNEFRYSAYGVGGVNEGAYDNAWIGNYFHHIGKVSNNNVFYISGEKNLWDGNTWQDVSGPAIGFWGVYTDLADYNIVRNNLVIRSGWYWAEQNCTGVFGCGPQNTSNPRGGAFFLTGGRGIKVYNNIIIDSPGGITAERSVYDCEIYNDTVNGNTAPQGSFGYTDDSAGIALNPHAGGANNCKVRNNIVVNQNGLPAIKDQGSGTVLSNNLTDADPRFVNAEGRDFHLQSSSPAINAGTTLPDVPCDFDGNRRPGGSAYDIGAYEYGSSPASDCPKGTTGGGATPTPATPTPIPPPVITLTATPSSLSIVGQGTQLFWTVQNATSCNASGGWSGAKDAGGGTERHTPSQSTTYVLTCTGPGGTAQKSVTVTLGTTSACTRYQSGSTIPQGFGVPWDVSNASSLLLKAECTPPTVVLKVGDNNNLTYVYKMAYVAPSGSQSWSAINLYGGTIISQAWYVGFGQGIAQIQDMSKASYYVAYTCKWTPTTGSGQAGRWKCGCRDAACTQSFWQIQRLQQ